MLKTSFDSFLCLKVCYIFAQYQNYGKILCVLLRYPRHTYLSLHPKLCWCFRHSDKRMNYIEADTLSLRNVKSVE